MSEKLPGKKIPRCDEKIGLLVELKGSDTRINSLDNLLRDNDWVDMLYQEE